jgi:hypothetical protein
MRFKAQNRFSLLQNLLGPYKMIPLVVLKVFLRFSIRDSLTSNQSLHEVIILSLSSISYLFYLMTQKKKKVRNLMFGSAGCFFGGLTAFPAV